MWFRSPWLLILALAFGYNSLAAEEKARPIPVVDKVIAEPTHFVDLKFPNRLHAPALANVVGDFIVYTDGRRSDEEASAGCQGRNVYAYSIAPAKDRKSDKEFLILTSKCILSVETDGKKLYVHSRDTEKSTESFVELAAIQKDAKTSPAFSTVTGGRGTGLLLARFGSAVDKAKKSGTSTLTKEMVPTFRYHIYEGTLSVLLSVNDKGKYSHFVDTYSILDNAPKIPELVTNAILPSFPVIDFAVDKEGNVALAFDSDKRNGYGRIYVGKEGGKSWTVAGSDKELPNLNWDGIKGKDFPVAEARHLQPLAFGFLGSEQRVRRQTDSAFVFYLFPGSEDRVHQLFHTPRGDDKVSGLRSFAGGVIVGDAKKYSLIWYGDGEKSPFPKTDFEPKTLLQK